MPTFQSGETYYLRVTPQFLTSGYDLFFWHDQNQTPCTAALDTKFANWLIDHPVVKWVVITVTVAVAVAIAWEGIALLGAGEVAVLGFTDAQIVFTEAADGWVVIDVMTEDELADQNAAKKWRMFMGPVL